MKKYILTILTSLVCGLGVGYISFSGEDKNKEIIKIEKDEVLITTKETIKELPKYIASDLKEYGFDINSLDEKSWKEFIKKVQKQNFVKIEDIVKNSNNSFKALFLSSDLDLDLIKLMIENGADINQKDENGLIALSNLFLNTNEFNREKIDELIRLGASLNTSTNQGLDILNMALSNKDEIVRGKLIEYLKENGISFDTSDNTIKYLMSIDRTMKNSKYISEIVSNIKDVNAKLPNGSNAFAYALFMQIGNKDISYFLDNGVDVNANTGEPYKIIHSAIMNERLSSNNLRRILDYGADINARTDKVSATPLMTAAYEGKIDSLKILLDYGADINLVDAYDRDVYYYANLLQDKDKKTQIVEMLKNYKKD